MVIPCPAAAPAHPSPTSDLLQELGQYLPKARSKHCIAFPTSHLYTFFFSEMFRFCLRVFRKTLPVFFSFVDSNPKPHLLELDYRSTSSQRNQRGTVPACKMVFTLCFVTCWFCFAAGEFMLFCSTRKAFKQVRL